MAKISSRTASSLELEKLQAIAIQHSEGVIGLAGSGAEFTVGETLPEVVSQLDEVISAMSSSLEVMGVQQSMLENTLASTNIQLSATLDILDNLVGCIDYDEALDHASADLMDCMCSRGVDVTANGELLIGDGITFAKEDIKPMLREAIVRWVELRMSK